MDFNIVKKKICFAISSYERDGFSGGKEKFTSLIIEYFKNSNKFSIDIICNRTNIQAVPDNINDVITVSTKEICPQQYDLIFSDGIMTPLKSLNADIKATYLHDFSLKELRKGFEFFKRLKYYILLKHLKRIHEQEETIKQFDIIFAVSEKIKDDVVNNLKVNPDKLKVIYPGLDDIYKKNEVRPYPAKLFTFGLSATNFKGKGGYIFLKALKILKKNDYNFKAIIIIPKLKERFYINLLVKLMKLDKQIELLPKPDNLDNFYKDIDCLCLPSLVETFGMVTLEAMGNGIPVIASNYCGCSEIIKHLDNGLVFEHKNSNNFAEMMLKLLNNRKLYENISKNGCETTNYFSWDKVYEEIIKNLSEMKK